MTAIQPLPAHGGVRLDPNRFRRALAIRGITAGTVAESAGLMPNTVSRILCGQAVSVTTLRRIAKALHDTPVLPGMNELVLGGDAAIAE
jgi:transcriptional regulator with XRE-family HTH domain